MVYVLIGISILFVAVGFILTEKNAKSLLSGYNTMSKEEREQFNLTSYISFFRNFHYFLGLTNLFFGLLCYYLVGEKETGIFIGIYPILAYIYFIWSSRGFTTKKNHSNAGIVVLVATLAFVIGIFAWGMQGNQMLIEEASINIEGSYGEKIASPQIAAITLGASLPALTRKTNGFALGGIKKGYFKTKEGEIVKLVVNSEECPTILIETKEGKKIYFSDEKPVIEQLTKQLQEKYSGVLN